MDVVLATSSYSLSNYPKLFGNDDINEVDANKELNNRILLSAKENNIKLTTGKIITSDVFDPYLDDFDNYINKYPKEEFVAMEMDAFCLFYLAKKLQKKAACLLTIVDVIGKELSATSDEREKSLKNMIKVALDSIL